MPDQLAPAHVQIEEIRAKTASGWRVLAFLVACMATTVALVWILH